MNGMTTATALRPYSRAKAIAKLDGRSRPARLMRRVRKDLVTHLGGKPSATQLMLIEQVVQLRLRMSLMDAKFAATGEQTPHDSATYLAWSGSLARLLRQLGMNTREPKAPTLADIVARGNGA